MHERVTEEVAAKVGDLVHISLQPTLDLVRGGHAPGKDQLGKPDLAPTAGSREASRSSSEQSALDNQGWLRNVVAPRRREHMLMLAEVQCRVATERNNLRQASKAE